MRYEILDTVRDTGVVHVFVRAWLGWRPVGFGVDGSCEVEHIRLYGFSGDLDTEVRRVLRLVAKPWARPERGKVAATTTVVRPNPGTTAPADGRLSRVAGVQTFDQIRNGGGSDVEMANTAAQAALVADSTTDTFFAMRRIGLGFDTSPIGTDTISSASLELTSDGKATGLGETALCLVSFSPSDPGNFPISDYSVDRWGSTDLASRVSSASWPAGGSKHTFALNSAGISHINKTGYTFFGLRTAWDVDGTFGGSWVANEVTRFAIVTADATGTTNDPTLTIEHSAGAGSGRARVWRPSYSRVGF